MAGREPLCAGVANEVAALRTDLIGGWPVRGVGAPGRIEQLCQEVADAGQDVTVPGFDAVVLVGKVRSARSCRIRKGLLAAVWARRRPVDPALDVAGPPERVSPEQQRETR